MLDFIKDLQHILFRRDEKWYIRYAPIGSFRLMDTGAVYYGPFKRSEIGLRLESDFALSLSEQSNLDGLILTDYQASKIRLETRASWMINEKCFEWDHKVR